MAEETNDACVKTMPLAVLVWRGGCDRRHDCVGLALLIAVL